MAINLSGVSNVVLSWLTSGFFWIIVSFILFCGLILYLWWKKRTRLKYPVLEIISFGNGKIGINKRKAGVFKSKQAFFGLWDYGNENCFKLDDGRKILECSTDDLQDIFGKKGFIIRRKDDDAKTIVPISRITFLNEKNLFEIASADFRDASVNIIQEARQETMGWFEKYGAYLVIGMIVIFFIISMMVITQFASRNVDKAYDLLMKVKEGCSAVQSVTAP